ncbi:putative transcription factor C2H2 family [Helianthus debilis subsp. tardiflorus]
MSRIVDLHDDIAEHLVEFFPNDDGLSYEEVLLQQASMYQSFQERARNNNKGTYDDDDISNWGHLLVDEGESSRNGDVMTQEAIDEALARSLEELGEGFDDLLVSELSGNASGSAESRVETPTRAQAASQSRQDFIDPDSMQYEELLQLAESVGIENRGISAKRISQLPTSKYRSGLFSKNKKEENCVICQMDFSYGDRLITLPCLHQYHTKCISDWLKLKKNCPICQKEVV